MRKSTARGMVGALLAVIAIGICLLMLHRTKRDDGQQALQAWPADSASTLAPADSPRAEGPVQAILQKANPELDEMSGEVTDVSLGTLTAGSPSLELGDVAAKWDALKMMLEAEEAELRALYEGIEHRQDAAHRATPKYREIREEMLPKAEEMLSAIDESDLPAVLDLSQKELDAFWDLGGLSEPAAYEHGYLARAILESTMDEHGQNFEFLSMLREAINTMTIMGYREYTAESRAACREETLTQLSYIWPVIDKQAEMLFSGQVEPSIEGMLVTLDWVKNTPFVGEDSTRGWQWLIENAEEGGWTKILPFLRKGLAETKNGRQGYYPRELWLLRVLPYRHNRQWELYSAAPDAYVELKGFIPERQEKNLKEMTRLGTENSRRILPSFKGSTEFQKLSRGIWEQDFDEVTDTDSE